MYPDGLGLTALISSKKDPWQAWAKHLASFGAQAALVAGSPFYQVGSPCLMRQPIALVVSYFVSGWQALPNPRPLVACLSG